MSFGILSQNEYTFMQLFWREDRPLTRAELLKGTGGRNWNPASIHLILNSLISKGAIFITDESKTYGRTYEARMTLEDYVTTGIAAMFPDLEPDEALNLVMKIGRKKKKG